jgi:S-adenosylmethionine:tRNA ribosyltransferase-isomerase
MTDELPGLPAKELKPEDYTYHLPQEKIAHQPLPVRSDAKLLHWKGGSAEHLHFNQLPDLLGTEHLLVFNNTRVVPARLFFTKPTGAVIEVLMLEPQSKQRLEVALQQREQTVWNCMVGNLKRWPKDQSLSLQLPSGQTLTANLLPREQERGPLQVQLNWPLAAGSLAEVLEQAGKMPLPPYIKREATLADAERYQTVYNKERGAVAAPTAGLHFTDEILKQLDEKRVGRTELTLHVGAGTFSPVTAKNALDHHMHTEQVSVSKEAIESLLTDRKIGAVGTTAMRTLESLYWFGVKLLEEGDGAEFKIAQYAPYKKHNIPLPTRGGALVKVLDYMGQQQLQAIEGETGIYIVPGYNFRMVDFLVTNFHLPGTTLLFLIAAFIGQEWEQVYQQALENDYRFLSYGDSSLLWRSESSSE